MKARKTFSILKRATIFDVDRLTLYNWIRKGCPVMKLPRPGRPARLRFDDVLAWRKEDLEEYYRPEGIKLMERQARQRLRAVQRMMERSKR
jgi:hypothetical protein